MDPVTNNSARTSLRFFPQQLLICGLLTAGAASVGVSPSWAALPQVQFDVNSRIGCRDVTSADFAALNSDEKLVEARFQVSSLIQRGSEEDLLQFVYHVASLRQTLRIVDYSPKTLLAAELAGNVAVEEKTDQNEQITGALAIPSFWNSKVTANGDLGKKRQQSQKYELLPPMLPIAASGTLDRGYGVYFKLKPSRRTSLEGAKEFSIVFRVAKTWRGDCVQLTCQATGTWRGIVPPISESMTCGVRRFTIALYAEGDAEAKATAERLVRAEADLLRTVSVNRREIQKRLYPTLAQKIGVAEPLLPSNWAEQLISDPQPDASNQFRQRLPQDVQQAVSEYTLAKRSLNRLALSEASQIQ
ncbi:MAG: hypothetical protein NTY19_35035 [Planctomycetota bacterium]|nr:hypothetical protein [Planctomycetota bacterium]